MKILSVLLEITPNPAMKATRTPLSSLKGTICNPTTSLCMEIMEQAFVRYASSQRPFNNNHKVYNEIKSLKDGSNIMASQEADCPRALPSDMVKNSKRLSINAVIICPKQPEESQNNKPEEEREENDNPKYINTNSSSPPDPSVSLITEKVRQLNSFFESLSLVPQSSDTEFVYTKGDDSDMMFIKIIKKNEASSGGTYVAENAESRRISVEYFDIFPTRAN
ncbi:hypothetical protein Tco_0899851 [Tanacetum coccineum]